MCQVECVLCAPYCVSVHHRETGFSWFLNAMPAANTPKEKLWEILYVLHDFILETVPQACPLNKTADTDF